MGTHTQTHAKHQQTWAAMQKNIKMLNLIIKIITIYCYKRW